MKWLVGWCCAIGIAGAALALAMQLWPLVIVNAALALIAAGLWRAV